MADTPSSMSCTLSTTSPQPGRRADQRWTVAEPGIAGADSDGRAGVLSLVRAHLIDRAWPTAESWP